MCSRCQLVSAICHLCKIRLYVLVALNCENELLERTPSTTRPSSQATFMKWEDTKMVVILETDHGDTMSHLGSNNARHVIIWLNICRCSMLVSMVHMWFLSCFVEFWYFVLDYVLVYIAYICRTFGLKATQLKIWIWIYMKVKIESHAQSSRACKSDIFPSMFPWWLTHWGLSKMA